MKPTFFATPEDLRDWFNAHHKKSQELWVGFHKTATGKPSVSWPEAVDEALCVGWIDGIRRSLGDESYVIRFTPRKARSTWSLINVKRAGELARAKRMRPAGLQAFEARAEDRTGIYTHEQPRAAVQLDAAAQKQLRGNKKAWTFFQKQPPWYQRAAVWWTMSAKKEETRAKRLELLIKDSEKGKTIGPLTRPARAK